MIDLKGTIVKEKDKYSGLTKWIKLTIGSHGIKQGDVMIKPDFPGLASLENHLKTHFKELANKVRKERLHPAIKSGNKKQIEEIRKELSELEHKLHFTLTGKKFRLIIYDKN